MFNNIGSKIKSLAKVCAWVGIIISVLVGFVFLFVNAGVGLMVLVFGVLGSWVGSFMTYGFGQLIENKLVEANAKEV